MPCYGRPFGVVAAALPFILGFVALMAPLSRSALLSPFEGRTFRIVFSDVPKWHLQVRESENSSALADQFFLATWRALCEVEVTHGEKGEEEKVVAVEWLNSTKLSWNANQRTSETEETVNMFAVLPNNATFTITHQYFPKGAALNFSKLNWTYQLPADSFKFSVLIENWPFQSMDNALVVSSDFFSSEPFAAAPTPLSSFLIQVNVYPRDTSKAGMLLNLLNFGETDDGKITTFKWSYEHPNLHLGEYPPDNIRLVRHFFRFEAFSDYLSFDPDLTVLLPNEQNELEDNEDSEEDTKRVIIVCVSVFSSFVLFVTTTTLLVLIRYRWKRNFNKKKVSVERINSISLE
ncbi:hypothetical protein QOT17_020746 [Balamuthia mandrillaris]